MARKGGLSVWETVSLHLARYSRFREEYEVPQAVTQDGVAEGCGVSRAHAALELGKLKEKGKVLERLAHVRGARTKKKVYFVSDLAYGEAVKLREATLRGAVAFVKDGKSEELNGEGALQRLTGAFGLPEARALSLIAVGEPLDEAELEAEKIELAGGPPPTGDAFFGREEELRSLKNWLKGGKRFAVILGMQGIGKGSLAAKAFGDSDVPTLWCSATGLETPEHLAREMAKLLASDQKYAQLARARPLDLKEAALLLAGEKKRALVVVSGYTSAAARLDPLMASFVGSHGGISIVLCCERRPQFYGVPELVSGEVAELRLVGLEPEACVEILERRGIKDPVVVRRLSEVTGGHPMALSLVSPEVEIAERDALRHLVRDVVGDLSRDEFEALSLLSVHRLPLPGSALTAHPATLAALLGRGLALEGQDGRIATHPVVRAAVASMVSRTILKASHSAAADYCLNAGAHHERLFHLWKAGRKPEVARHFRLHLGELRAAGNLAEALEIATDCCQGSGPQTDDAVAELAMDVGNGELALSISKRLAESTGGDVVQKARLRCARLLMRGGDFQGALRYLDGVEGRYGAEALRVRGGIERRTGHYEKARKALEDGLREAESSDDSKLASEAANELGVLALNRGDPDEALRRFEVAAAQAKKAGARADEALIAANIGLCHAEKGDMAKAADAMAKALKTAKSAGLLRLEAAISTNLAHLKYVAKDYEGSVKVGERAVALLEGLGDKWLLGGAMLNLGRALVATGKREEGIARVEEGLRRTEMLGDLRASALRFIDAARAYGEAGDAKRRRAAARRAAEIAGALKDEVLAKEARRLAV